MLMYNELVEFVDAGFIEGVPRENINGASIDLTLGDSFYLENDNGGFVDLSQKQFPAMNQYSGRIFLEPDQFALASTREIFHLPADVSALFVLKSSLARAGLNHLNAGFADPHWNGSVLTLEYKNSLQFHTLILSAGMKCGQMIFWRGEPVPHEAGYAVRGQYNGDRSTQQSKGVK